jgi:hypothetical protein
MVSPGDGEFTSPPAAGATDQYGTAGSGVAHWASQQKGRRAAANRADRRRWRRANPLSLAGSVLADDWDWNGIPFADELC